MFKSYDMNMEFSRCEMLSGHLPKLETQMASLRGVTAILHDVSMYAHDVKVPWIPHFLNVFGGECMLNIVYKLTLYI